MYIYCGCCLAQVVFPAPGIPTIKYRVAIRLPPYRSAIPA
jgi:hypothetical protein